MHEPAAINGHPVSWVSIWKEQNYDESPIKSALAIKLCSRRWCRDAALCSVEGGLPLVGSHSSHASLHPKSPIFSQKCEPLPTHLKAFDWLSQLTHLSPSVPNLHRFLRSVQPFPVQSIGLM